MAVHAAPAGSAPQTMPQTLTHAPATADTAEPIAPVIKPIFDSGLNSVHNLFLNVEYYKCTALGTFADPLYCYKMIFCTTGSFVYSFEF